MLAEAEFRDLLSNIRLIALVQNLRSKRRTLKTSWPIKYILVLENTYVYFFFHWSVAFIDYGASHVQYANY